MRVKLAMSLLILIGACLFLVYPPNAKTQNSSIVTLPLTFHGYSLLLRDANGSFCVYEGADGAPASSANAVAVNLESQITGQRMGFDYWSAVIMWTVKLPMDLHIQGTVNMRAYISSTFKLSGLFTGGGYGMGIVDIDENNVEVKEFITEAPYSIGSNPFTSTPTQYSTNTNIDYVFKKGHSIGFAVGLGATVQGFAATVYFGSADRNSGATLPVEDISESHAFNADGDSQSVSIVSNSAISNCQYDSSTRTIQFRAEGVNYTTGHCTVSIPKTLMQTPFIVTEGLTQIAATLTENATHYQLGFTHTRTSDPIKVAGTANPTQGTATPTSTTSTTAGPTASPPIPEYTHIVVLAICILTVLLALVLEKRFSKPLKSNSAQTFSMIRIQERTKRSVA